MKHKILLTALLLGLASMSQAQDINILEQNNIDSLEMFDFGEGLNLEEFQQQFGDFDKMLERISPMMTEMSDVFQEFFGDFQSMMESPDMQNELNNTEQSIKSLMEKFMENMDLEKMQGKLEEAEERLVQ